MARHSVTSGQTMAQHAFAMIPSTNIERSKFNRSCGLKTTFDEGYLIPIFMDEALPGDTFSMKMSSFVRLATPLKPFMDNLYLEWFFFFVPNRLLWDNWKKMNGEQVNPGDSTSFNVPKITSPVGGYAAQSIYDYFGIPTLVAGLDHSALWPRAYNLIWNEWFRDQNLQNSVTVNKGDGPDASTDCVLLKRGKRHDYFTSALPFPQKGTAVSLPLGSIAMVKENLLSTNPGLIRKASDHSIIGTTSQLSRNPSGQLVDGVPNTLVYDPVDTLYADLSTATAATINDLRQAFQIQRMFERDARGGTRYTEILRSHFGVISPDARLQRPEFLGGGSTRLNVNPIAQTSPKSGTDALGQLAAFVSGGSAGGGWNKSFVEHGVILGLANVRADLSYQQGLERQWSRRTRFDFFWPALAHLGEQTILNKEIFADGSGNDALTFGYQERYAEYRYKPSLITGKFRSNTVGGSFDVWHLAQNFASLPALNATFIQDAPPIARVISITTEPHFIGDFYFQLHCARPMPIFSVPGLIDHF